MAELSSQLDKMDWTLPTEIQVEAIPLILGGGDVLMASETGTGKTGAFCIPVVQIVYEQILSSRQESKEEKRKPKPAIEANRWLLSIVDRAPDVVLSQDLLMAQSKSGNWQGCRANKGIKRARGQGGTNSKVYYEVHFAEQGLARLGWSFSDASFDLGTDRSGFGYGGTAKKSNNRQFTDYGQPFGEKFDIVGCILDLRSGELSFTKNGRNMGVAFKLPIQQLETRELYPTICVKNAGCQVRFEQAPKKNDYKPADCIWVSEAAEGLVVSKSEKVERGLQEDAPLALILEPSRELAKQTFECIQLFASDIGIKTVLWVGGDDNKKEQTERDIHIVVCTPGRLSEAISKKKLPLHNVHFFILDETDGLLQQGNQNLIRSVHSQLPKMFNTGRRLQTICCSATLHDFEVKKLAQQLMYFPTWIDLKGEDSVPETVHHLVLRIDPSRDTIFRDLKGLFNTDGVHSSDNLDDALFHSDKPLSSPEEFSEAVKLMKFYYTLKALESFNMEQGIIFCRTKLDCDNLCAFMDDMSAQCSSNSNKYSCVRLHSGLSQRERVENLNKFRANRSKYLVCTDVAARGIDVKGVPLVIQVSLPEEKANYVHRIGRVGRADRMGLALSLVSSKPEKVWFHTCRQAQKSGQCKNRKLVERGGCCKWLDELAMLADIEEHLKCSIGEVERDLKLQVDEFDGKVVYGGSRKRLEGNLTYEGHVEQLATIVNDLARLESNAQSNYLRLYLSSSSSSSSS